MADDAVPREDEPLAGWLEYAALRRDFATLPTERGGAFLAKYRDTPVAQVFRNEWLAALAKNVHAKEKDAWLWLLDSDEKANALLAALPKVEKGDAGGFPREWFQAHTKAYSVLEMLPKAQGGGKRWALYRGPYASSDLLAVLPCVDGAGGCK